MNTGLTVLFVLFPLLVTIALIYLLIFTLENKASINNNITKTELLIKKQDEAITRLSTHLDLTLEITKKLSKTEGISEGVNQEQKRIAIIEKLKNS